MITIDTKAYMFRMIVNISFLYFMIFYINKSHVQKIKVKLLFLLIVTFLADVFIHFSDMIPIFGGYFLLKKKNENEIVLFNNLIICVLINYCISMLSSTTMIILFSNKGPKGYSYVLVQIGLEIVLLVSCILIYKKYNIKESIEKYSSKKTAVCLLYLVTITIFLSYVARFYQIFDLFIIGILTFLIIQTIFVLILFFRINIKQKEKYEEKLKNQELIYLKKYTDQLEKKQDELIKFRHDYKNLLLSFKETAFENDNDELSKQFQQLENYSNAYLSDLDFDYRNFHYIKNNYLKSLLISKFYRANKYQLDCHFECLEIIDDVPIPVFDCVRVLGIILDNAIEAGKESNDKKMRLMIYKDVNQIEFLIENSCLENVLPIKNMLDNGFTTKKNHQGVGMSTVQDINRKNQNMFVQYENKKNFFITQIILMW
ncbi:GHKL domain-containing protein [Vagococcus penaei]|uniref:ATP-binding protein n=1 Tax=Vagococcus penaei TaxID=633807 RepID=A0A1Q2D6H0_9ENTE|nr:GHKL domain-containing protein [Vagococcus penaei]AQP53932.1 ATP-binding protein [Vagococcus penaei]